MAIELERFIDAQDRDFDRALAELNAGAKRTHWIWYIFPQLAGLGHSPMAEMYGLRGVEEAGAYLGDPRLHDRLLAVMNAVRAQRVPLGTLMGSDIDALKLVSSMTLFRDVARRAGDEDVRAAADEILEAAKRQGFAECQFTLRALALTV